MVYKYYTADIGKRLYEKYRLGSITTEEAFKYEMDMLIRESEGNGKR